MNVAYLVAAHNNPRLLRRAIGALSCENSAFFIHVDRKSNIEDFSGVSGENVLLSEKRLPVYWGGFSLVQAVLLLLRQALDSSRSYDYFVLVSGSDYPLRSGEYIRAFLQENRGVEFINTVRIPSEECCAPLSKINSVWFEPDKPVRRFTAKVLTKVGLAQRDYTKYLGSLEPYAGDTWWALTRDACQYIMKFVESNRHVGEYFQSTPTSDEMFFQTILGNSSFASRIRRSLHYADWSTRGRHPAMINDEHVACFESNEKVWLDDSWGSGEALFARKFSDSRLDLVQRIDEMIARKDKGQTVPG